MSLFALATPGLSLWSIPAAFAVAYYPNTQKYFLIGESVGFDNVNPRSNISRLESSQSASSDKVERAKRLGAAHQNGFEIFPIWTAAILSSHIARLDTKLINSVTIGFIALRLFYNHLYANHTTEFAAALRSAVYYSSLSAPVFLLVKAGFALNAE